MRLLIIVITTLVVLVFWLLPIDQFQPRVEFTLAIARIVVSIWAFFSIPCLILEAVNERIVAKKNQERYRRIRSNLKMGNGGGI